MGLTETLLVVLAATVVIAVVLAIVVRAALAPRAGAEGAALAAMTADRDNARQALTDAERDLAIQRLQAARLSELEATLTIERARTENNAQQHAAAEARLAGRDAELAAAATAATDLRQRLDRAEARAAAAEADVGRHAATIATLRETLDQERKSALEKLALLQGARAEMTDQFKVLAEEVMTRHGADFTKLNKEQIDALLAPVREKLVEFQAKVEATHHRDLQDRATLGEKISSMIATSADMKRKTEDLTEALRGRSQLQGAWGEMVLATVLEQSGLRAGHEYTVQQSVTDEHGRRLRPDVVINLPGGQRMVVDSKVSLTAYERLVAAATDEERAEHVKAHVASLRSHIGGLGSKEYHRLSGSTLTFVVMFVPIEGALAAALRAEPDLAAHAVKQNVMLTTPTTLLMALRTVHTVWQTERRNLNAEDIAKRAGALYDKFHGFVTDLAAVGTHLAKSQGAYDDAMRKLQTGNGNLVRQVQQLRQLGAAGSKTLPAAMLETAGATLSITSEVTETEIRTTSETVTAEFRLDGGAAA